MSRDLVWSEGLVHIIDPKAFYSIGAIHTGTYCGLWAYCLNWRKVENAQLDEMCAECEAHEKVAIQ